MTRFLRRSPSPCHAPEASPTLSRHCPQRCELPQPVLTAVFSFLPGCESVLPLLCRRWQSDAAWKELCVATWGRSAMQDKRDRDVELCGLVDPEQNGVGTWRRYFCQRKAGLLLAKYQRHFEPRCVTDHSQINGSMRERLVDWMIEVCDSLRCSERVLHTAVQLVDMRIAGDDSMPPEWLQLTGTAALQVALEVRRVRAWCAG